LIVSGADSNQLLIGTASQVEWAERIRQSVDREFDRVANAFEAVACKQTQSDRAETRCVIALLEEKRAETMANDRAGYFIRNWQELSDQVRRMIAEDHRYQAIHAKRLAQYQDRNG
jgi:hypothetical protein